MENGQNLSVDNSRIKILVVDDHPNTADMLARALSHLGSHVQVFSATSAREALQHVENGAMDILITDMVMPRMTGLELIEKMNSTPSMRPAVSFVMTAYELPGLTVTARRLKVKEVITKPVSPERICQLILLTMDELRQSKLVRTASVVQKTTCVELSSENKTRP
jgi:CheY-like chemotaxis protein